MMTRGATVRDMSDKLKAALRELDSSRNECSKLLREREESEVEIEAIVNKNTQLKSQLAELHTQHIDILDQHHHLRQLVSGFHQCHDTHDQALKRISELEAELCKANNTITSISSLKASEEIANTNNLFSELIDSVPGLEYEQPTVTIDLTGDDTLTRCPIVLSSHKKIKKYIKINKSIKKYKKLLKTQSVYKYNINLRRELRNLKNQLNVCNSKLESCTQMYDVDIQNLQRELLSRENTLKDIFCKYECSQQMLSERMQEACELVDLVKYNAERYESLTNNLSCSCAAAPPPPMSQHVLPAALPIINNNSQATLNPTQSNILVFSDRLGTGFGSLLNNRSNHTVLNHCHHNLHFNELIHKIQHTQLNEQSTVVLLVGNSLSISKKDIVNGIDTLLKLRLGKLILCAFPYSDNLLAQENDYISSLNTLMHILSCRHSDRLLFFDTNNFVRDFVLIRDHYMFLPKISKHLLATLLAFNIHAVNDDLTETRLSDESVLFDNTVVDSLNY